MSAVDYLTAARDLLTDEVRWTKMVPARNADGRSVIATDDTAVQWDVIGALLKVGAPRTGGDVWTVLREACWSSSPQTLNDDPETTHADVLELLDNAIALVVVTA